MIFKLYNYIIILIKFIILNNLLLPLLLNFSILILIFLLLKPYNYDLKIRSFLNTILASFIYIFFYILFFFILRYLRLNKEIDLKLLLNFKENLSNYSSFSMKILLILIIIILILLWIIIFIKINKILRWNVYKLHFYFYNASFIAHEYYDFLLLKEKYPYFFEYYPLYNDYRRFILKCNLINYQMFTYFIQKKLNYFKYFKNKNYMLHKSLGNFIRYFLILLLILFFSFECFFNNFILYWTLYYILFYFIFNIWYQISYCLNSERRELNGVLFDINYLTPEIIYINLNDNDELELQMYLINPNDIRYVTFLDKFIITDTQCDHPIIYYKKYKKYNQDIWYNQNINKYIKYNDLLIINNKYYMFKKKKKKNK